MKNAVLALKAFNACILFLRQFLASFLILLNLLPPEQEGLRVEEGQAQLRVGGQQVQVAAGGADGEAHLDGDELRALHQAQRQHGG